MRFDLIGVSLLAILSLNISMAAILRFSNVVCQSYNETTFVFNSCRLKAISRDKVTLNLNGTILYPGYNIKIHIRVFKRENGFKPWLFNVIVDGCRFMRTKYVPIAKIMLKTIMDYSNINHSCPYLGPILVQGFYLKPELLVLPFPSGEYMVAFRWFYDDMLQGDINVTFLNVEDIKVG